VSVPGTVATGSIEFAKSSNDPLAIARGTETASLKVGLATLCDIVCGHAS